MNPDATQFVTDFPEFNNATNYPVDSITFWLTVAALLVNAPLWGDLTNLGIELLAAHNLVMEAQSLRQNANGAVVGIMQGPIASKGIDGVNVSYAVEAVKGEGAELYNLTTYGLRYWQLARMIGAGGLQL